MRAEHQLVDFLDRVDRASQIRSPGLAEQSLGQLAESLGFKAGAYLATNFPSRPQGSAYVLATYRKEWVTRYVQKDYHRVDPVAAEGLKRLVPFDWDEFDWRGEGLKTFLGEAREFGVASRGLSIPIRGPFRETALLSLNGDHDTRDWAELKRTSLPLIQIAAYEFHKRIVEIETQANVSTEITLSKREMEILRWAAEGKTAWETAQIMGISERTVNFFIAGTTTRLNCVNKTHAVATAIRKGLI